MKARCSCALLVAVTFSVAVLTNVDAENKKTLKIGAIFSVTGPAAGLGDPEKKTADMIVEQVNRDGGVNGFPVQLIVEDDEGKVPITVSAADKLINRDQVMAIIGPSRSGNTMEIKNIAQTASIPLVSCAAAETITNPLAPYVFKVPQLDSHVVIRIIEQMQKMGISKTGLLSATEPFGQEGRRQVRKYATEMGLQVVEDLTYEPSDSDMTAQLKKLAAAGPEAIINWSIMAGQSIVPKNMKQLGMKIPLFQSHGFGNPKFISAAGDAAEGTIFVSGNVLVAGSLPDNHWHKKVVSAYSEAFEKKYGPPVTSFGGHAYDAVWMVINAIKAKNVSPDMDIQEARRLIREGLEQTRGWIGVHGEFNMSPTDHVGLDKDKSLEILYVDKGGKIIPYFMKDKL